MTKRNYLPLFVLLVALFSLPCFSQTFGDTVVNLPYGSCAGIPSANNVAYSNAAVGTGVQVVGAAGIPVFQVSTSAAATHTWGCDIACNPMRSTFGKGCTAVVGFAWFYNITTTTATSMGTWACVTINPPAPAASETASVAAGTAISGVTQLPAAASANLTAVNTGQFYTQFIAFGTPPSLPGTAGVVYQKIVCSSTIGQTGASAMLTQSPGGLIFTTNTVSWMRKHGHRESVDAMVHNGIQRETAELIFAHYVSKPVRHPKQIA